jgi:hypothetical protein
MFKLFVSHSSLNKRLAHNLREELKAYGVDAFVAHDVIEPTADWQNVIEYALRTADAMVALLSKEFRKSRWCDQEVGAVLVQNKLIVSVDLGREPHGFLGRYQGLKAVNLEPDELSEKLFRLLLKNEKSQPAVAAALVSLFEGSDSFQEAKDNAHLLEMLPRLDKNLGQRVRTAIKENSQVSAAFGVPARVTKLLEKWRKAKKQAAG